MPAAIKLRSNYFLTRTVILLLTFLAPVMAIAQDSRVVSEPSFPPSCVVLTPAQISGSLNETSFDTARLQNALNTCPAGQAMW